MSTLAQFSYDEKTLEVPASADQSFRSLRHYDKADASIKVGEEGVKPKLRDDRRLIAVEAQGPKVTLFSPRGILTRDELDLIDLLANSLVLDRLLPEKAVAPGDSWKHSNDLVAALCGLDSVTKSDAQSVLTEVSDELARIDLSGRIDGKIHGVSTSIELKGKFRFDRKRGRISWFGLLVKENRAVGPIGPGVDVVAKLQMQISPREGSESLGDSTLADLPLKATANLQQLAYASQGRTWELNHDRRWFLISESGDTAILRRVHEGEYLAQCRISTTGNAPDAKPVTLAGFQEEIRQALGKNFEQIVTAAESENTAGYRVLRVVIRGQVSEVPIEWIYYLISDKQNHRTVFAMTVEGRYVERFGNADQDLARGFAFREPSIAKKN